MKKLLLLSFIASYLSADIKWDDKESRYYSDNHDINQYEYHILASYFNSLLHLAIKYNLPIAMVIDNAVDALIENGSPEANALLEDLEKLWNI